jgi:hypothetical protein
MKLNQLPNFRVEDFPSEQSWISKLFTQLNPFVQTVNQVFDSNIDFATNIRSVSATYTISSFQPFSLQWPYKNNPPADLRIIQAQKGIQLTSCILLPAWNYDSTKYLITVDNIVEIGSAGISALSGSYKFTIRAVV